MQFGELAHENNFVEIVQGCMSSSRTILSAIGVADKLEKYCVSKKKTFLRIVSLTFENTF